MIEAEAAIASGRGAHTGGPPPPLGPEKTQFFRVSSVKLRYLHI